jgi:DNA-binding GntR family transcriptional regulator
VKLQTKKKQDTSLSGKVYQTLTKQILSGRLNPGDKITEAGVSKAMGISQSPVREALKRLAEDQLVILVPRSGCFIAHLDADEIAEIFEIRKQLECMALNRAFETFNINQLKSMKKKFQECLRLCQSDQFTEEIELDSQLHTLITQTSGCKNVSQILEKFQARIQLCRVKKADRVWIKKALREHINILEAILTGDKEKSLKALKGHIEHTKKHVLLKLGEKMDACS